MIPRWSWRKMYLELKDFFQNQMEMKETKQDRLQRLRKEAEKAKEVYEVEAERFVTEINGVDVEFVKGPDGGAYVNADDICRANGQQPLTEFLSTDEGLDALNRYRERMGKSAFGDIIFELK